MSTGFSLRFLAVRIQPSGLLASLLPLLLVSQVAAGPGVKRSFIRIDGLAPRAGAPTGPVGSPGDEDSAAAALPSHASVVPADGAVPSTDNVHESALGSVANHDSAEAPAGVAAVRVESESAEKALLRPVPHVQAPPEQRDEMQSHSREENVGSRGNCEDYHGKTVVLATVDEDFVDFFENWHAYASKFLRSGEHQLVVVAENENAYGSLSQKAKALSGGGDLFPFEVSSMNTRNTSSETHVRVSLDEGTPPYGSGGYSRLVHRRPQRILSYLQQGCTVLYADIDAVWIKDPFQDIAAAGEHDLYLVDDRSEGTSSCANGPGAYFCTCFLYVKPTPPALHFFDVWARKAPGNHENGNQFQFNSYLCRDAGELNFAVLPRDRFPPGCTLKAKTSADMGWFLSDKGPSVVHANWKVGHAEKKGLLEHLGFWGNAQGHQS
eukprot:TRINITY_DN8134_c0_g1_i4.p1 TRINITY_DN8134_c0_g1~~TRINITY_DN8134_c0_g1_i4.p1  ORF type:complete len:437 (-),score=79.61 TRINITY_DN8134_c0_g1_i4:9-1319(-)